MTIATLRYIEAENKYQTMQENKYPALSLIHFLNPFASHTLPFNSTQ